MAASNTRFTQNSLGQSKTPIDSDHGIYRYVTHRPLRPTLEDENGKSLVDLGLLAKSTS